MHGVMASRAGRGADPDRRVPFMHQLQHDRRRHRLRAAADRKQRLGRHRRRIRCRADAPRHDIDGRLLADGQTEGDTQAVDSNEAGGF